MFMLGALSNQPSPMVNPIAKLQHWWDCDEVGTNVVRYDSHGSTDIDTFSGTVDERAGLYNNGMDFNSTSDYCRTAANTFTGDTSFAMCQWVYLDTTSSNDWLCGRTGAMSSSVVPASWHCYKTPGGQVYFNISADGSLNDWDGTAISSVNTMTTGQWHFLYLDYDAATSTMRISVDNETPVSAVSAYNLSANGNRLWWGLMTPTYPHGLDGIIDSIAYFDGPLTDTELAWMWNGGAGRQYSDIASGLRKQLVSWWDFEEASGNFLDSHQSNDWVPTSVLYQSTGINGFACESDAITDIASIASGSGLEGTDRDFCVVSWVYKTGGGTYPHIIWNGASAFGNGINESWMMGIYNDGKARFTASVGASYPVALSNTFGTLSNNTWYMLAGFHDAANSRIGISVNGGAIDWTGIGGTINTGTSWNTYLFKPSDYDSNTFVGRLDSMGFWDRLLTTDELTFLYNAGASRSYGDL